MGIVRNAAAAVFAAALFGSAGAASAQTLTFGGSDAIGSILDRQNVHFTKLVNERGGGRLKVNFIQGEQLGNDMQVIEQMMQGSVQIYGDVLDWYANWVKDFSILAWGFTFRDPAHMQRFLDSDLYKEFAEKLRKDQGIRILAAAPTQPRVLFAKKQVRTVEDLSGIKMRVPEIKTYLRLWETLGTRPSRLAWGEVYLGLKTGVVEAAEGPIGSAYAAKFHEAAKFVMRTDHLMSSAHITVNEKAFAALSPEHQKILLDAARDAVRWTAEEAQKDTEETVRKMTAEGASVVSVDRASINAKARAAVETMEADGAWTKGLWQRIQDM